VQYYYYYYYYHLVSSALSLFKHTSLVSTNMVTEMTVHIVNPRERNTNTSSLRTRIACVRLGSSFLIFFFFYCFKTGPLTQRVCVYTYMYSTIASYSRFSAPAISPRPRISPSAKSRRIFDPRGFPTKKIPKKV